MMDYRDVSLGTGSMNGGNIISSNVRSVIIRFLLVKKDSITCYMNVTATKVIKHVTDNIRAHTIQWSLILTRSFLILTSRVEASSNNS